MVKLSALTALCSTAFFTGASPIVQGIDNSTKTLERRLVVPPGSTGSTGGYYYSLRSQTNSGATMNIGNGSYSLNWDSNSVNVIGGIGWNPGSARNVTYSGSFTPGGNSYLSLYGWTSNPVVEYYVTDNYGASNPASALLHIGTLTSDGGIYDIYRTPQVQVGTTSNQYWSVRQMRRTGGTINTANHFNAWKSHGMVLGVFNYQILATEGFQSTGSSSITIL